MNISQPVNSIVEGVSFGVLSSKDIIDLSVKRITFPNSLDARLHPIPGGLHDLALGAFLDNPCATCLSDVSACPGHCGHIELPVKVFHCSFMDQAYRLVRAQCVFCQRLRMRRQEVKIYCCKLRLLRWGLLKEVEELDDLITRWRAKGTEESQYISDSDEDVDGKGDDSVIIEKMESFAERAIKREQRVNGTMRNQCHSEVVGKARKTLIRNFLIDICKTRICRNQNCGGISPSWRKNKYTSIFKKPLSERERKVNTNKGLQAVNQLVTDHKRQKLKDEKRAARRLARSEEQQALDEGVADLDDSSHHEELDEVDMLATQIDGEIEDIIEHEDEEEEEEEEQDVADDMNGSLIQGEANLRPLKKNPVAADTDQIFVNASEAHASLKELFLRESEVFGLIYSAAEQTVQIRSPSADMFFIDHLLVPPNKYRKESKTGPEEISESPENSSYRLILAICDELYQNRKDLLAAEIDTSRRLRSYEDFKKSWLQLQDAINSLFDQDRNPARGYSGRMPAQGIKQKLEKKEGIFRMNIMGKRVNFAARSVISPDPNIETNEIGIPPVFAQKLTYPEPVTQHTFEELKQAVINGPEKYPGAASVEMENGQIINLRTQTPEERIAIANRLLAPSISENRGLNKKVHRHLNNGDIVIMNRQPTLHKPSMMCHRARVLKGEKTIRMHYANCKTYNADFDGDEMNMHFPQNEIARAEALQIADTDHQYISATAGEPLRGLIQDHISICVHLTSRDTFFSREDYQLLLYAALRPETGQLAADKILTLEPAFLKPRELWTGKQIISTILLNIKPGTHEDISLSSRSSTQGKSWGIFSEEGEVFFQKGELITGIIDKKQIGPSAGGLVHMVYEAYGHIAAGQLLSILGRLLTKLLNMHAFSCGLEDLVFTDDGEKLRNQNLADASDLGAMVASKYVSVDIRAANGSAEQLVERLEQVFRDEEKQVGLDTVMNAQTKNLSAAITEACLPYCLIKPFPKNQMQAMTTSGAKGSLVNANLISCNLGQQVLEGRRVPTMISGKTLPSFKPFETNIRAGGYIIDRFLTGVRPQEYYFHAMAGREGLIDTAVKTSRSGYLQRCLVKGLEGLRAEYDYTVRDSDGTMVQTLYGEDGVDITKQLGMNDLKFIAQNHMSIFASLNVRDDMERLLNKDALDWNKKALKKVRKARDISVIDPAISIYPPGSTAGSTSEKFAAAVRKYIDENPDNLIRDEKKGIRQGAHKKTLQKVMNMNYMKSVIEPGEAIGVVAAQSIGEPSTQMTLNTFHLAGHSAKNVTLGIPRLREILMTASLKAKTPTMSLQLLEEMNESHGQKFAKAISRLPLADVIDQISVTETILIENGQQLRQYQVQMELFPSIEYCKEYAITVSDVVSTIEMKFIPWIHNKVQNEFRKREKELSMDRAPINDALPDVGKSARRVRDEVAQVQDEDEHSDEEEGGDDDADKAKRQSNMDEGTTYDDPDEDEVAIERQGEREADDAVSDSEDSTYGGTLREPPTDHSTENEQAKPTSLFDSFIAKERQTRVIGKYSEVSSFRFDDATGSSCTIIFSYKLSSHRLLFLPIVENAARSSLIQHIPGIGSCTYAMEEVRKFDPFTHLLSKDKLPTVVTDGCNLAAMSDYQDIINPYTINTNDIGAILRHYGIEACRNAIINEMRSVFSGHAIEVDARHLSLVADYMTRNGGFDAFSRTGMNSKTGVFAKMSFETTVGFLRQAVLERESEDLTGPSARITVGRVGKMGTGAFDVFMPAAFATA